MTIGIDVVALLAANVAAGLDATIKAEIANPGNGRYVRVGNAFYQATTRPQPRLTKPGEIRRCAGLRDLATSESRPPRRLELPERGREC